MISNTMKIGDKMFVDESRVMAMLEQRGLEAGCADAKKAMSPIITERLATAIRTQGFDAWSRGYVKGFYSNGDSVNRTA